MGRGLDVKAVIICAIIVRLLLLRRNNMCIAAMEAHEVVLFFFFSFSVYLGCILLYTINLKLYLIKGVTDSVGLPKVTDT